MENRLYLVYVDDSVAVARKLNLITDKVNHSHVLG